MLSPGSLEYLGLLFSRGYYIEIQTMSIVDRRTDDRNWNSECGMWKWEGGMRKWEDGSGNGEVGRLEIWRRKGFFII